MDGTRKALMGVAQGARVAALWRPEVREASEAQASELLALLRRTGISEGSALQLLKMRLNSGLPPDARWDAASLAEIAGKELLASEENGGIARIEKLLWQPTPMTAIPEEVDVQWLWRGYLAKGQITLLSSHPKAGKTTLVSHFLREADGGGYLAGDIASCKVLVISEEHPTLWKWRQRELGFAGDLLARPFRGLPEKDEWEALVDTLALWALEGRYNVIILDPLASQAPIRQENDSGEMLEAITPLRRITDAGAALLLVHHVRKSAGAHGTAGRGSSALQGFVDIILELSAYAEAREDTRRKLTAYSRMAVTPPEVVLQLTGDNHYEMLGLTADFTLEKRDQIVRDILTQAEVPLTREEILEGWPVGPVMRPCARTLLNDLQRGSSAGTLCTVGRGFRADPFRYGLPGMMPPVVPPEATPGLS
jgi:hypothetical protein